MRDYGLRSEQPPCHQDDTNQSKRTAYSILHELLCGKVLAQKVIDNVVHNLIVLLVLHVSKFSFLDHSLDVMQGIAPSCHPSLS